MNITPISTYLKRFLSFSDSSIPSQQHISDIKNYTLTQDVFSLKSSNDCKSSQTVYDIRTQLPSKCVLDDKISELESALRNNPDFADNKHREFISNPLGRELASTMILSDPDLQIQITEKMFGEVSKSSINSMLSMLQSHERELSNQVLCSFDSVMVEKAPRTVRFQERFLVQIGTKIKSVPVAEVAYFMADGKYLMLYTHEGGGYILDQTMAALEERLDPQIFFRINRKFIVSFSAIKEMIRYSNNRIKIGLSPLPPENIEAIVSADRIREFRDWLNR